MKKKSLIIPVLLAISCIIQAQTISDFEVLRMNLKTRGANDQSSLTVVPNPDPSGIDTSKWVVKFLRDKDGSPWGGFWGVLLQPVNLTYNKFVHVKIWKPRITPISFKIEEGPGGITFQSYSMNPQSLTGAWEEVVFDFSSAEGLFYSINFSPDIENPVTLTEDIVIYFNDITINNDPTPGSPPAVIMEDYEIIPLNLILGNPALDSSNMTIIQNPDPYGFNVSNHVVRFLRDKDGLPGAGFWSPTAIDITTNKYMHVKVWKPRVTPLKLKIEGGAAGDYETFPMHPQETVSQWEDIVFDLSSKTGIYPVISFMPDYEDLLTLTQDIVIYFDDIILSDDSVPSGNGFDVSFNIDMRYAGLLPGEPVYISGSFGGLYGMWSEPGTNPADEMTDPDHDSIYSILMVLPKGPFQFKFLKGTGWTGGEWDGPPNRNILVLGDTAAWYLWGDTTYVAVHGNSKSLKVTVSPVPFSEKLIIETQDDLERIILTSMTGRKTFEIEKPARGRTVINTSLFAPGIYLITYFPVSGNPGTTKIMKY